MNTDEGDRRGSGGGGGGGGGCMGRWDKHANVALTIYIGIAEKLSFSVPETHACVCARWPILYFWATVYLFWSWRPLGIHIYTWASTVLTCSFLHNGNRLQRSRHYKILHRNYYRHYKLMDGSINY